MVLIIFPSPAEPYTHHQTPLLPAQCPLVLEGSASSPIRSWSILAPSPESPAPQPSFPPLYPSTFYTSLRPQQEGSSSGKSVSNHLYVILPVFSNFLNILLYSLITLYAVITTVSNNICEELVDRHLSPTLEYKLYESQCKVCFLHYERSCKLNGS